MRLSASQICRCSRRSGAILAGVFFTAALYAASLLPTRAAVRPPTLDPTYGGRAYNPAAQNEASWIWADTTADNQTVAVRRAFTLATAPGSATLYVTADDYFTLFINGRQVDKSGTVSTDGPLWRHVHQIDVAKDLVVGKNVIAVLGVNGVHLAGVLARLDIGKKELLFTDKQWRVGPDPGASDAWTKSTFDDSRWKPATIIFPLDGGPWPAEGGVQGWPGYHAGVETYLSHLSLPVVAVLDVHPGEGKIEGADTLTHKSTTLTIHLAPVASKDPPGLVVDFGKELTGRVEIETANAAAVLVGLGESREEAVKSPWHGPYALTTEPGKTSATPPSAFRFAHLVFPATAGATETEVKSVSVDHIYYPVEYRGAFDCSDPLLTRIWYTGAYTCHLCMQQDIWDAPKRDRLRWMGDLHVSGAVINTVFADRFLMEQSLQRLRDDAQGGAPPAEAPHAHVNGIPGYSCAWICGLADFHRHIGDREYLGKQHDLLISLLEYFRAEMDDRGLFANKRKAWPFVDWSPGFNEDTPQARAATHLFLIKANTEAVFLLREMHDEANAQKYKAWGEQMKKSAEQYLVDAATNTFGDRRQTNAMAIYAGVATPEQSAAAYERVLKPGSPDWNVMATPYYNNYVIYAMSMAGHTRETLDVLRDYWGGMLAEGATTFWEAYDPKWDKNDFHAHLQADNSTGYFVSLCHGWSAGPTSWLTERVLGVNPTSGGYQTATILPDLGDLQWASGAVPTPQGKIEVEFKHQGAVTLAKITVPSGIKVTLGLPGEKLVKSDHGVKQDRVEGGRVYVRLTAPGTYLLKSAFLVQ